MKAETVCFGRRKIGNAFVSAKQATRMVLPLQSARTANREDAEILLMVHLVWTDDRECVVSIRPSAKRRPAARLRLYTSASASCSVDDERKQRAVEARSIGTRRELYPSPTTYKTASLWLPVKGPYLFVHNASAFDNVRVAISALAIASKPEEKVEENVYADITELFQSDELSLSRAKASDSPTSTVSAAKLPSLLEWRGEETVV